MYTAEINAYIKIPINKFIRLKSQTIKDKIEIPKNNKKEKQYDKIKEIIIIY